MTTPAPSAPTGSLQLRRLRRSGDGGVVRRAALQRPDRPPDRRIAGARHRRVSSRRSPAGTILDVGTGTGRAAIALARRGRGRHRRRRVGGDARRWRARRAAEAHATVTFAAATRTASTFADQSFDAVVCLRVLMHTPDWRQSLARAVPRRARSRGLRLSGARERRGASGGGAPRRRTPPARASRRIASSRPRRSQACSRATGSGVVDAHRQFVLPIALHKRIGSVAATRADRGRARAARAARACSDRR